MRVDSEHDDISGLNILIAYKNCQKHYSTTYTCTRVLIISFLYTCREEEYLFCNILLTLWLLLLLDVTFNIVVVA